MPDNVLRGKVPANGFTPDNAGLSPFMQRLARAHANCVENLPIVGGLLLVARVFQSLVHLASLAQAAVMVRFTALRCR